MTMQFNLVGFTQDAGFRVFAFEGIAADRTKVPFTVRTDLALIRKYGIRVQELPLLCRGILERRLDGELPGPAYFTEEDMRLHSRSCSQARDAALQKRKTPRRYVPVIDQAGAGWRGAPGSKTAPDRQQLLGGA